MSTEDVFAAPKSVVRDVAGGSGIMTDGVISAMTKTRPWVLFLAIMGFIGAGITALAAIPMLMGGALVGNVEGLEAEAGMGMGMMMGMGALYLVSAILYFMASLYLLRYAGAIKRLTSSLGILDLESALQHQASFWKLLGILTIVTLVLLGVLLVAGIMAGSSAMLSGAGAG